MKSLTEYAEITLNGGAKHYDIEVEPDVEKGVDLEEYDEDEFQRLKIRLPSGVNIKEALAYGFYEHKNRYWIRRAEDTFVSVSNFTMRVEFLIEGANPKRIVDIRNVFGRRMTLDFAIEDMISLDRFKGKVEGSGNFLFDGSAKDLSRIKSKLYNNEKAAKEIARLMKARQFGQIGLDSTI